MTTKLKYLTGLFLLVGILALVLYLKQSSDSGANDSDGSINKSSLHDSGDVQISAPEQSVSDPIDEESDVSDRASIDGPTTPSEGEQGGEVELSPGNGDADVTAPLTPVSNESENNNKVEISISPAYLISGLCLIVTFALIFVLRNLILWRAKMLDGQKFLMPESLIHELTESRNAVGGFKQRLDGLAAALKTELDSVVEISRGTKDVAMSFQEKINAQDKEIQRYREGHSAYLHRKFIGRFFRVYERLQKVGGLDQAELDKINLLFEDAFAEAHVEIFSPDVGENYPDLTHSIEDQPDVDVTTDASLDWKISSIERPGMRALENPDEIIVKAKVRVYRLEEGEE